ncbi:DUF4279 domain-containing protein [Streptomyces sp. FIT100]|uniref:DUF4279 domain-containing protein n=1 Tax=Streptomyces sp. FIT100 TaxID=2837956 RepID=UPI0021C8CDC3|nr:DUF4279 domain-containing protein [Streptomyces sp. FIT100]UUN27462.1 DUF4279 domain-containing protein [Streptomyces sp. FIT100]
MIIKKSDLDPEAITQRLGIEPSATRAPGPDRWGPPGDTDGQWRLQCDERTTRIFSEQLDVILKAAEGCAQILAMLRSEGFEVTLVVRGYADNDSQLSIPAAGMARISRLGVPLTLRPSLSER